MLSTLEIVLISIASFILILIILFLLIGFFFFKGTFSRIDLNKYHKKEQKGLDDTVKLLIDEEFINNHHFEEIFIKSNDNLKLAANFLKAKNKSHKYVIFFHGYRGSVLLEWSSLIHLFYDHGYNIFSIHERANHDSEGKYFTMGPKEKDDLACWVNYLSSFDKDSKICLFGHSMGGHIVLLGLGEKLKDNVKCAISDCGYASLKDEIIFTGKNLVNLKSTKFLVSIGELYIKIFHKMSLKETTMDSLKKASIPICLIHGSGDKFVPFYNLDLNYNAIKKGTYKEKHVFIGAAHCSSESLDMNRYHKIVLDFVDKFID